MNIKKDYSGAAWNAIMEEETKESLAELYIDGLDDKEEVQNLLVEWRDAREEIFKASYPSKELFARLGAAEIALMGFARKRYP